MADGTDIARAGASWLRELNSVAVDVFSGQQHGVKAVRLGGGSPVLRAVEPSRRPAGIAWREGLPTLEGAAVVLRELCDSDAPSLAALLTDAEVSRFLSPPPTTAAGVKRFVRWTQHKREAGQYACFAIVPAGSEHAVGFFQLRSLDERFETAEWGFVLGRPYWGTGLFTQAAALVLSFAFGAMGVRRLEARAVTENRRAMGALQKLGAVAEGVLRQSFSIAGQPCDTTLWALLESEWRGAKQRLGAHRRTGLRLAYRRPD